MNYSNAADNKSIYLKIRKTGKSAFFLNEFLGSQAFILGLIFPPPLSFPVLFHRQAKPELF